MNANRNTAHKRHGVLPNQEDRFWYKLCEDIVQDNPVTEEQIVDGVTPLNVSDPGS